MGTFRKAVVPRDLRDPIAPEIGRKHSEAMTAQLYRDVLIKAVEGRAAADGVQNDILNSLTKTLGQTYRAKEILRKKGYGRIDMSIDSAVKLVPDN